MVGLGEALDALQRFDEADTIFRRATEWNPTSAVMHYHRATHLRLAGRDPEAAAEFKKSLECSYNPAALRGMELLARSRLPQPER
jgi:Flp pilus assembly protein TadD